jgi:hypothetical protein
MALPGRPMSSPASSGLPPLGMLLSRDLVIHLVFSRLSVSPKYYMCMRMYLDMYCREKEDKNDTVTVCGVCEPRPV